MENYPHPVIVIVLFFLRKHSEKRTDNQTIRNIFSSWETKGWTKELTICPTGYREFSDIFHRLNPRYWRPNHVSPNIALFSNSRLKENKHINVRFERILLPLTIFLNLTFYIEALQCKPSNRLGL